MLRCKSHLREDVGLSVPALTSRLFCLVLVSLDTFPGMWDVSVGGHFTAGESSLETAVKETSEELGLDCDESSLRFVCTVATTSTGSTAMHGDFVCNEYKVPTAFRCSCSALVFFVFHDTMFCRDGDV